MRPMLLLIAFIMTLTVAGLGYLMFTGPDARAVGVVEIAATAEQVERGRYLARHVLGCLHCHTKRDAGDYSLPATGPEFGGGNCIGEAENFPGVLCAGNVSSDRTHGIGAWTNDEILRAMREGISRDGRALFPLMPYGSFRRLSDDDAHAVVAYLRTIPAASESVPETELGLHVEFYVKRLPRPLERKVKAPPASEAEAYGGYLATVASCKGCHEENLSGGKVFPIPNGPVRSANLTPHATGSAPQDPAEFIAMFRRFAPQTADVEAEKHAESTVMPWRSFAGMTDSDLEKLHVYLRGGPPIDNQVNKYGFDAE